MKNYLSILSFLLFFISTTSAKQVRFYGSGELSCNLITGIAQDGNGFVWIGTADGLNKFDGWTFTKYFHKSSDKKSLSNNYVYSLYSDRQGMLWVGGKKGLQRYLPYEDTFQSVLFPENIQPSVEDMIELNTGEIWIVTSGMGAFSIDKETLEATPLVDVNEACKSLNLSVIYLDKSNRLWIPISNAKKILLIDQGKNRTFHLLDSPGTGDIFSFVEDEKGGLFLSSSFDVHKWIPDTKSFITLKNASGYLTKPLMVRSQDNHIYMGSSGQGLRYIDPLSMEILPVAGLTNTNKEVNLDKIKVEALLEDKNGNLWIGCFRKGLLMIPNESSLFNFWNFSRIEYETGGHILSIYKDSKGIFWAGHESGKLMRLNGDGSIHSSYSFGTEGVSTILETTDNTFWVGLNYGGLFNLDRKTGNKRSNLSLSKKYIKSIAEDKEKKVYFSVFGDGFVQYDPMTDKWKNSTDLGTNSKLRNNWINTIKTDSKGNVWFGHYNGVDCYDPERNKFYTLACDSILYGTVCYSLLETKDGTMWIGTTEGLYAYHQKTGQCVGYTTENGLPDNVICGLAKDSLGNVWCSTFLGICHIDCRDNTISSYLSGNGLFDKEYSRGVSFQYDKNEVYFGGIYGITWFNPNSVFKQETTREPVLTGLFLNNQPASAYTLSTKKHISETIFTETSSLRLSHKDNTFALEFSTMDYKEPENISYRYRIIELNTEWSQTLPNHNRIEYNRLPPGSYTLNIKAQENGVYSPEKTILITILPPWYLSPPAKMLYIFCAFCFLGIAIYMLRQRSKKRRQEELNEEKLKFFINISHEIRSPITLIISPLAMLLKREYDEVTTNALKTMNRNANRIANLLNQLLDIRKIDKGLMKLTYSPTDLVIFIEEIMKNFEYSAEKWNLTFSFQHEMDSLIAWIDRNNLDKVLINLLSNAFKFTPEKGEITVSLSSGKDESRNDPLQHYAEIRVIDSGDGIDEKKINKIFERFYQIPSASSAGSGIGLNLSKTITELHHGTLTATNRKDKPGSCFIVRIPLKNNHLDSDEMIYLETPLQFEKQNKYIEKKTTDSNIKNGKSIAKHTVLVIDDNEDICLYIEQELKNTYNIVSRNNGTEGLQAALTIMPDLIISDIIMPEMDGFTLLKNIKTNGNISHIPVILLTSRTEYDYRVKGWDIGADAILTKPFNVEELLLLCSNLITGRLRLKGKFTGARDQEEKIKSIELKSNEEQLMERLMNVINNNMDNPQLNVESLAREAGISRVQLHRKMKEIAGISTGEFIRNIRLRQAAKLLKAKKLNISQIAYAVGYSSSSLFSGAFKKFYGISPSDYAKKKDE